MTSTDSERAPAPATDAPPRAAGPRGLPQRAATQPVRQRNRVSLEVLAATFAGLQQIDETTRPAAPLAPPPELWPPVTGSHPHVTG
ncbi:hypothetical protein [Cellulomonas wangsupingiae]|uniref:Uncharacterized protein n=1 Tax=Cellulomonas wangsupingiae TaxID=2968085 RepID=A0ABY5K8R4_9CELL|nr:hypothetical protein [Cellulomonas wangsupingiae]MCC2336546.1 hypothetical protein [Cellulomonas wangsupingiae]MCC2336579.1 hypothetical protein [Cellulomonas wangsupingiae]MCM0641191.1 hypothetical protein [Cellulomonas wangsupingiae]UUI65786.1 hypothetical protein NP075_03380 [Cellulomonas wangsupingiae]